MIDLVQALVLFEICADEMAREGERDEGGRDRSGLSLTARALAKRQLDVAHLSRFPIRGSLHDSEEPGEPAMTLGAAIVFRTADRFGRAGATTERTLDAVYRAAQRYVHALPGSPHRGVDERAITLLMAEARAPVGSTGATSERTT